MLALEGLAVVQQGESASVAFAARMLRTFGAQVTLLRTPGSPIPEPAIGDPRVAEALNLGKTIVDLDPKSAADLEFLDAAIAGARIVVTSRLASEIQASLAERRLPFPPVLVSVTPWGAEGPAVMRTAGDMLQYHAGGLGSITPRYANNPGEPPLRLGFPMAEYIAGLNAAVAALSGLNQWRESGEPVIVDVSGQQAIAYAMGMYSAFPAFENRAVSRVSRPELAPYHFLPCKDGWIMTICPEQHQWRSLVDLMGNPEWADSPVFETSGGRAENWDAIEPFIIEWLSDRNAADVYRDAQARRIPLATVSTMADVLASPQLASRGYFAEATIAGQAIKLPGVPFKTTPTLASATA